MVTRSLALSPRVGRPGTAGARGPARAPSGAPHECAPSRLAGSGDPCVFGADALWFHGAERLPTVAVSVLSLLFPVVAAALD